MAKLSRLEYLGLENVRDKVLKGLDEDMIDKLVILGLADAIKVEGRNSCQYVISDKGIEYLQENQRPRIKLSIQQAIQIFHMLGDAEYDCAPPFYSNSSVFKNLIKTKAVEPVYKNPKNPEYGIEGYALTADGKEAFEESEVYRSYKDKLDSIKKRETIDQKYNSLTWSNFHAQSRRYRIHAWIAKRNGDPVYAKELTLKADRALLEENALASIKNFVRDDTKVTVDELGNITNIRYSDNVSVYKSSNKVNGKEYPSQYWYINAYIHLNIYENQNPALEKGNIIHNINHTENQAELMLLAVALVRYLNSKYIKEEEYIV